ncbi:MAG TPA: hypothetical protein VGL72_33245 [Bryobacteraceae bacterium]|jgi:hypothetical protein
MKMLSVLGFALVAIAPQVIGQENLHTLGAGGKVNITFNADSIERQDPDDGSAQFATVIHLKGNVVIRSCCMQWALAPSQPKQAVFMRGDEAVYHQEKGEIEFRGIVKVSFQDYPK